MQRFALVILSSQVCVFWSAHRPQVIILNMIEFYEFVP